MGRWWMICLALSYATPALGQEVQAGEVDHTDPVKVTAALFDAAKTGDPSKLASLCHPDVENDGDTQSFCDLTIEDEFWSEFVEWFARGKVSGSATITEGVAVVPILFGPDGTREERMELVLLEGKWYLTGI